MQVGRCESLWYSLENSPIIWNLFKTDHRQTSTVSTVFGRYFFDLVHAVPVADMSKSVKVSLAPHEFWNISNGILDKVWQYISKSFHVSNIPSHSLVFSRGSPQDPSLICSPPACLFSCYCSEAVVRCAWKTCSSLISCPAFQHMRDAEGWDCFRMQSYKVSQVGRRIWQRAAESHSCDELSWTWTGRLEMSAGLFLWD